jgi:hypothetical protein
MGALNVSASVAANFGPVEVDAKSEFIEQLELSSTSVVIAVYANVIVGTQTAIDVAIAEHVAQRAEAGLNQFCQDYGDSFVSSLTQGGEYIATYVFYSQSTSEQKQVLASLAARGLTTSGSVSTSMQAAAESVQKSQLVRASFSQQLLGYAGMALPLPDDLVGFALGLAGKTPTNPTVIAYETTGYEHVPGMNAGLWAPVVTTRNLFLSDLGGEGIAAQVRTIRAMKHQAGLLGDIYRTWGYTRDAQLAKRRQQVQRDEITLTEAVNGIRQDPTAAHRLPNLESISFGLPVLNATTPAAAMQAGGKGGDPWWDVTLQTILNGDVLTKVTLRAGDVVDNLTCVYGQAWVAPHGGSGGKQGQTLQLQPGEFISEISGRAGAVVDYVALTTTKGQYLHAGGGGGGDFSWSVPQPSDAEYTCVVGFCGRAGRVIDAIGVMTATFRPATWQ